MAHNTLLVLVCTCLISAIYAEHCTITEWSPWSPCRLDGQKVRTRIHTCKKDQLNFKPCTPDPLCGNLTAIYNGTGSSSSTPPLVRNFTVVAPPLAQLPGSFTEEVFASVGVNGTQLIANVFVLANAPLGINVTYLETRIAIAVVTNCNTLPAGNDTFAVAVANLNNPNGTRIVYPEPVDPCTPISLILQVGVVHRVNATNRTLVLRINNTQPANASFTCVVLNTTECCENCTSTEWSPWSPCRLDNKQVRTRFDNCTDDQVQYRRCNATDVCASVIAKYNGTSVPPSISNFFVQSPPVLPGTFIEQIFASVSVDGWQLVANVSVLSDLPLAPGVTYNGSTIVFSTFSRCGGQQLRTATATLPTLNVADGATLSLAIRKKDCESVSFTLQITVNHTVNGTLRQLVLFLDTTKDHNKVCEKLDTRWCCNCVHTWGFWKRFDEIDECYDPMVCSYPAEYWFKRDASACDAFVLLVHQYLAAFLNENCGGAYPSKKDAALIEEAGEYLEEHCDGFSGSCGDGYKKKGFALATQLTKFNEGERSVPPCKKDDCSDVCRHDDHHDWRWLSGAGDGGGTGGLLHSSVWLYLAVGLGCIAIVAIGIVVRRLHIAHSVELRPLIDPSERAQIQDY